MGSCGLSALALARPNTCTHTHSLTHSLTHSHTHTRTHSHTHTLTLKAGERGRVARCFARVGDGAEPRSNHEMDRGRRSRQVPS